MKTLLLVFLGGGSGSVFRYLLSKWLNNGTLPLGTLVANVLASLILGFITGKVLSAGDPLKFLIAVGFCGGFSTFSTFSNESFQFFQTGNYTMAIWHIFLNLFICLAAIGIGLYLAKSLV